jgi:MoxR-like ATPase
LGQISKKLFEVTGARNVSSTFAKEFTETETSANAISDWNVSSPGMNFLRASRLLRDGVLAVEAWVSASVGAPVRDVAVMRVSDDLISAEYAHRTSAATDVVAFNKTNGLLLAAKVGATGRFTQLGSFGQSKTESAASILFCLIPVFQELNPAFDADIQTLVRWYPNRVNSAGDVTFSDDAKNALFRICDAFYPGIVRDNVRITNMDQNGNITKLERTDVDSHVYDGIPLLGVPRILVGRQVSLRGSCLLHDALLANKKRREESLASLSPEQLAEVPHSPDNTVVPSWVTDMVESFYATENTLEPFNNFRVESGTGGGKTFGVRLMAEIMGKPLKTLNLDPDSDKTELKSQIVPNTKSGGFAIRMPSFLDIVNDPVSAYEDITGVEKIGVSVDECQEAYNKAMAGGDQGKAFRHILSPLMQGLQGPYIVEIQEMSRARAGVLSGLNEVFDRDSVIHLEGSGEQFKRNPKSIVVSTDNFGYSGCKPISPDVRRRFSHIERLPSLSDDDAVTRAIQRTEFDDRALLKQMWKIIKEVAKICREKDIRAGDVGLTELIAWAMKLKIGVNRTVAFTQTVLTHASGDDQEQKEINDAIMVSQAVGHFFD